MCKHAFRSSAFGKGIRSGICKIDLFCLIPNTKDDKNMIKKLTSSFVIFTILLLTVAALMNMEFLSEEIFFDKDNYSLTFFGNTFLLDKRIPVIARNLLCFNVNLFGAGFSKAVTQTVCFLGDFLKDTASLLGYFATISTNWR